MDDQRSIGGAAGPGHPVDPGDPDIPSDPRDPEDPGDRRPARPLDRAPSERYRDAQVSEEAAAGSPPVARAVVFTVVAAVAGGIALAVAGEMLKITAGLVVIAAVLGWVVAAVLTVGLEANPAAGRGARRGIALTIALFGVALGQVGLWLIARNEGGVLGLVDYLAEVFGFLVPLEFALAAAIAWWRAA